MCLGDRPHSVQELWRGIEQQTDEWLLPVGLKPGLVVCNNGRNLVAALGLAGLTHIPCLAHVLNLVVQKFIHNYPDMSELLHKMRPSVRASSVHILPLLACLRYSVTSAFPLTASYATCPPCGTPPCTCWRDCASSSRP